LIDLERIERLSGYGMTDFVDGYVYRPTSVDDIRKILKEAQQTGRQVTLRGAGRSYGDAAIGAECVVIDLGRMNRVLCWDKESGILEAEPGVTIEGLWRTGLEDGYWPSVVSGTMFPMLGGALAMNIHGKNAFHAGPIGEYVLEFDLLKADGTLITLKPEDELFYAVIGGAGLLGIVTRVKIRMKKVASGDLRVLAIAAKNWDEQFEAFEKYAPICDYDVSWIDCFGKGKSAGRGLLHMAWYAQENEPFPASLKMTKQDLPDTIMGLFPKSIVWRALKFFSTRWGMKFINWAKYLSSCIIGNGKTEHQSLVAFSFLLDYVPNWRWAYLPGGFIQYQSFVPKEHAKRVFAEQIRLQQEAHLESYLAVMKRHRPDKFLLSYSVDGYSLALDFKVTRRNRARLRSLAHKMNDLVLEAGGRFYLAKDSTLRPQDVERYLGSESLSKFRATKKELDPGNLFTSELDKRVHLSFID
jgi:decaprenylphospho-beta-D-ribofuranose 2-oxidase